ncbi:hypothetical protein D3C77_258450 [compost metagenome]
MLKWLVNDRGIAPHIPIIDKSGRTDGTFSRADFTYDHAADLYRSPGGKELKQYRQTAASVTGGDLSNRLFQRNRRTADVLAHAIHTRGP